MNVSADAGGELKVSKYVLVAGVLGLTAIKIVSAGFHNYQLYEVDRLVSHISRHAEAENKRRQAQRSSTPRPATPTVNALSSDASRPPSLRGDEKNAAAPTTAAAAAARPGSIFLHSAAPETYVLPSRLNGGVGAAEERAKDLSLDDRESTVDVSACSHGLSSVARGKTASKNTSQPALSPLPPPVITSPHPTPQRNSVARASLQPLRRSNSGISITSVHLVGGEPAQSTSHLVSQLLMAGARPCSSPYPAAAAGASFSGCNSLSSATGNSFSVVDRGVAEASTSHREPLALPSGIHEGGGNYGNGAGMGEGVVNEMEPHGSANGDLLMPPAPVIIFEDAVPAEITEGTPKLTEFALPTVGEVAAAAAEPQDAEAGRDEEEEEEEEVGDSPLPYFAFTTTSVHMAPSDAADAVANHNRSNNHTDATAPFLAATAPPSFHTGSNNANSSKDNDSSTGLPRASVPAPSMNATDRNTSPRMADGGTSGRSMSLASAASSASLARPVVHFFIQPRWALAPSLSPTCTKWEAFLRLHRISYVVHEVHVLRSDQPQAQSTDVPQQIQDVVDRQQHDGRHGGDDDEDTAAVAEARAFANVLTETGATHKMWGRVRAELHRVLPAGLLPGDPRTQYSLPFIMVGGTVLKGSFNEVMAELTRRGLVRSLRQARRDGGDGGAGTVAAGSSSPYSPEEQLAIGQAVERTAEYTLRLLYEVGLLLEGSAVFSHYAAQLWSGHRYWDLFQVRRWFVYAWLAIPFLSALKADVSKRLLAQELGGLTREQLYRSLQSDLVSLEQLLVSSAETMLDRRDTEGKEKEKEDKATEVHFLLGREPGPQDCALYAYLLPILRLTPRDIAHIHNPNFAYIYDSRIFRSFVDRMSREAFPDLDVLLNPPRRPSFSMSLSNAAWEYMEDRATPGLVAMCMHVNQWNASMYRLMCPCRVALQRCLEQALKSKPVELVRRLLRRVIASGQRLVADRHRRVASSADTTVAQDGEHVGGAPVRVRDTAGAVEGAAMGVPQPTVHMDSSTQVTGSLDELVLLQDVDAPVVVATVTEKKSEEEAAAVVSLPAPVAAVLTRKGTAEKEGNAKEEAVETEVGCPRDTDEGRKTDADAAAQTRPAAPAVATTEDDGPAVSTGATRSLVSPRSLEIAALTGEGNEIKTVETEQQAARPAAASVPSPPSPRAPPASAAPQRHQSPQPLVQASPLSPRVVHACLFTGSARHNARRVRGSNSPARNPRSGRDTAGSTATLLERGAAPSPRRSGGSAAVTSASDAVGPRFAVQRASGTGTISRSLGSTVGPGSAAPAGPPQHSSGPSLDSLMASDAAAAATTRPTTAKTSELATHSSNSVASQLRVPRRVITTRAASARPTTVRDDSASDSSSSAGEAASSMRESRVTAIHAASVARSSTSGTPERERRPSGLTPGLFATVVHGKVYVKDDLEHPSWRAEEPHRRSASVVSGSRSGRASPTLLSRRGSLADSNGRDGVRSPVATAFGRTVTPIRKLRPSPGGRPSL
ncbi:hypothetical protein ABB37_05726 [Leptomonas pyrrhocoris]|uniref:Uncharacterized protein n=1 Tax=Leptomonas pyrrhocoris TaxID=157538 RepID=A0A0M9FZS0_LEPPY|nr:hypothetical protein ABB37_05726 [Leptomonas pyrrhocoris]KPA79247.1 hypothetical protein ABB37_05726 [Leptomonas pyrrhocoris]|eukprot:XP_015657686.1 hypothetical protein ABB37_05726 [Leptomonas pyrrhocoris]